MSSEEPLPLWVVVLCSALVAVCMVACLGPVFTA